MPSDSIRRMGSGVYRLQDKYVDVFKRGELLYGSLHHVIDSLSTLNPDAEISRSKPPIDYLVEDESGEISWVPVNVREHKYYGSDDRLALLGLQYKLGCPMTENGLRQMASQTGVSFPRLQAALKQPYTSGYRPLSKVTLLYMRLNAFGEKHTSQ